MMNRANRRKLQGMKRTALILCLMLAVCVASVGGTIAWLTAQTAAVTNTFTAAGIDISLVETKQSDGSELGTNGTWSAKLVPGKVYTKNPVVTVAGTTDVDVYLFVKAEVKNNEIDGLTGDVVDFNLDWTGWTLVEQNEDSNSKTYVYCREVKTTDPSKSWHLIKGYADGETDKVKVNPDLTKTQMPTDTNAPSVTFTAYAIQTEGTGTVAEAWAKVPKS